MLSLHTFCHWLCLVTVQDGALTFNWGHRHFMKAIHLAIDEQLFAYVDRRLDVPTLAQVLQVKFGLSSL